MTAAATSVRTTLLIFGIAALGLAQSPDAQSSQTTQIAREKQKNVKKSRGAAKEIGSGAGNVGTGAAKGAGSLAKGTAKGAGELVTLHPVDAATSVGSGAVHAGKDVGVGTAKGTGKIVKGIGKAIKHLF